MRVLFIRMDPCSRFSNPHPQNISIPMDIAYSISILEEDNHKVEFIDTKVIKYPFEKIIDKINQIKPHIIGIYSTTATIGKSLKLAKNLKDYDNSTLIFLFGQHATALPETILFPNSPVDLCVRGECEFTIKELVRMYSKKEDFYGIKGISFYKKNKVVNNKNRKSIQDLNKLPFPKYPSFFNGSYKMHYPIRILKKAKWGFMLSSRGCSKRCIFCSPTLRVSYGKNLRLRSPKNIVDEIEYLISKKINAIYFLDDNFMGSVKHVENICDEIINRNVKIKWAAQIRPDKITKKILQKMKKAGCSTLSMGVESGSERILEILHKDIIKKQIEDTFKKCKAVNLLTIAFFMIGNPTETIDEIKKTFNFCKKIKPDIIQVAIFTPYPGSPFFEKLNIEQRKLCNDFSHYNKLVYNFSKVKNLTKIQKSFYKKYYFSPTYIIKLFKRIPFIIPNLKEGSKLIKGALLFLFKDNNKG